MLGIAPTPTRENFYLWKHSLTLVFIIINSVNRRKKKIPVKKLAAKPVSSLKKKKKKEEETSSILSLKYITKGRRDYKKKNKIK